MYYVIYDGNCNLCVSLVQSLEQLDQGQRFRYVPMQDQATLAQWQITPADCELGMILLKAEQPEQRWQGSAAAEEIGRLLPAGEMLIQAYRALPGMKWMGDRAYEQIRDRRYQIFGKRKQTYQSHHPVYSPPCAEGTCPPI
jgi:predicted DCC family thiol-disulfide oxidoreductase YuxK